LGADFTSADWFNALGLTENQLSLVRPDTLMKCPHNEAGLRDYLDNNYGLEGQFGGGKSTLASLLVGMRTPQSGLMFLEGLDWTTLGVEGWRRREVSAPRFHENHVLSEAFAFNLLMGSRWPPSESDRRAIHILPAAIRPRLRSDLT
jgi:ABC-type transport system involved in cytochrome bd biosynthesis fused ATPase/permease subunit